MIYKIFFKMKTEKKENKKESKDQWINDILPLGTSYWHVGFNLCLQSGKKMYQKQKNNNNHF